MTDTFTASLSSFFDYLDRLTVRAPIDELRKRLTELEIAAEDLARFARFGANHYLRNLLREGPLYHALVLCWRSGQRSPIHDHAGSTCGLRVLKGTATETVFARTPSSLIKAVSSKDWHKDDVSVSQDGYIHQVSNLLEPGHDLITLHIYSPPLLRMSTYSLTDTTIGEYRPMVLEHALGSGI